MKTQPIVKEWCRKYGAEVVERLPASAASYPPYTAYRLDEKTGGFLLVYVGEYGKPWVMQSPTP